MDDSAFDSLARRIGTRRIVVAGLAALLAGGPSLAEARRRRKCGPNRPCATGFSCSNGRCVCTTGVACGETCCAAGETCIDGQCAIRPQPECLPLAAACKGAGVPCCAALTCASGQGGLGDVACYVPAGGACRETSDCVYGTSCADGTCVSSPQPPPQPTSTPEPEPVCDIVAGPDAAANGVALKTAIADATAGATILIGAGEYLIRDLQGSGTPSIVIARDLTLAACTADTPTLRFAQISNATRGSAKAAFLVNPNVVFSMTGLVLQGAGTTAQDCFQVSATARLNLASSSISGFPRGVWVAQTGGVALGGGVSITGCTQAGIVVMNNGFFNPPTARFTCTGVGNGVTGNGGSLGNCSWFDGSQFGKVCPTDCGCGCPQAWDCSAQICVY